MLRCLKEQTGAEIHFLTKRPFAGIVAANPHVDRVIAIDKDLKEVALTLVQSNFDGCIDLHGNLRTLELKLRLRISRMAASKHSPDPSAPHPRQRPKIRTFDKLNFAKFLLTKLKINRMPDRHIVQRYLDAAADFGVVDDGKGLDYFVPVSDRIDLLPERLPTRYLAFVIGAAHATKCLTEAQMRTFCEAMDYPIILLGGPAEQAVGERVARGLTHVTNACGRYNLNGSADLIRQATLVVTHDTGLMHIAAAFDKKIVSIWGNTVPAFGMYPYLPGREDEERRNRREVEDLPCRPCSKIGFGECPKGHFRCITEQSATAIATGCVEILSALR